MFISRLSAWWKRLRGQPLSHLQFIFYTRQGCHLCDEAWQILSAAREHYGFVLEAVDVDTNPELVALYGSEVPVVTVDGKVRFRGAVNKVLLKRLLNAELALRSRGI